MKSKLILCLALVLSSFMVKADIQYEITDLNSNVIPEGISNYCAITNRNFRLVPETFAVKTDLGWITADESKRLMPSESETRIASPLGSKEFVLASLTDATRTPYEQMKAHVFVFQDAQPKWEFNFTGFKNFDADWIDEKILKIVSWPGGRVKVTELLNVETGKIVYRSVEGFYDKLDLSSLPIRYHNAKYDLTFYLPETWKGYSVSTSQWEGDIYLPKRDKSIALTHGPIITLRNPQWRTNQVYQDIWFYVFTRQQWDDMNSGKYSPPVGAGGVIDELWHNDKYVFGIHSRYNADDSVNGWQEAQDIVKKNTAAHPEPHLPLYDE